MQTTKLLEFLSLHFTTYKVRDNFLKTPLFGKNVIFIWLGSNDRYFLCIRVIVNVKLLQPILLFWSKCFTGMKVYVITIFFMEWIVLVWVCNFGSTKYQTNRKILSFPEMQEKKKDLPVGCNIFQSILLNLLNKV